MKCPHCFVAVYVDEKSTSLGEAAAGTKQEVSWRVHHANCPNCHQKIISVGACLVQRTNAMISIGKEFMRFVSWPQSSNRPLDPSVPDDIARDYSEAVRVLPISPQASAALTRRILQQVLRDFGNTKSRDLDKQIDEVIAAGHIATSLTEQLDAVRSIGNFAAHPLKSQHTGLILPVEANEAEWNLDVLEAVFDHYFVKPALAKARKDALNKKLQEAGKPVLP